MPTTEQDHMQQVAQLAGGRGVDLARRQYQALSRVDAEEPPVLVVDYLVVPPIADERPGPGRPARR